MGIPLRLFKKLNSILINSPFPFCSWGVGGHSHSALGKPLPCQLLGWPADVSLTPPAFSTGREEIQCSLPLGNRRIFLHELSEASFSECRFSLSLTDLFIIIFSGVAVSIAAIISSFFLATVVQCFQRCAPNKDTEDEDEDEDD